MKLSALALTSFPCWPSGQAAHAAPVFRPGQGHPDQERLSGLPCGRQEGRRTRLHRRRGQAQGPGGCRRRPHQAHQGRQLRRVRPDSDAAQRRHFRRRHQDGGRLAGGWRPAL